MQHVVSDEQVLVERRGTAGLIRLNRPKALNSLTLPMIRAVAAALDAFEGDAAVASVAIMGEGERGFCAGGDIRALRDSGLSGDDGAERFLREEFRLNHRIAAYSKPFVALMDGITMGGGVGLSAHGRFRVVTERTRLAMPETAIGYVPDVGGSWLLSRAPGEIGTWMGLTGLPISGADALYANLADGFIAAEHLDDLVAALAALPSGANVHAVADLLKQRSTDPGEAPLARHAAMIDRCFRFDTVEDILRALEDEAGEPFAQTSLATLAERSPTSLVLTLRLLREARHSRNLEECLNRELAVCLSIARSHDLLEGIRAAVVDKDKQPKWRPARLEDVDPETVERCFTPLRTRLALSGQV